MKNDDDDALTDADLPTRLFKSVLHIPKKAILMINMKFACSLIQNFAEVIIYIFHHFRVAFYL